MNKIPYRFIIILLIINLVLPNLVFSQIAGKAEKRLPRPPETLEGFQGLFLSIIKPFQGGVLKAWQEVLAVWQRMKDFFKNIWNLQVKPSFQNIWEKAFGFFKKSK